MIRSLVLVCFGLAIFLSQAATNALAQPPEILRNYRFLPQHSTLQITGGFLGLNFEANLFGTYDFVTGFDHGGPVGDPDAPTLHPFAEFVDVDVEAIGQSRFGPHSCSLDQALNLSGLEGEPLPTFLPNVEAFRFLGVAGPDEPVELFAVTIDRWMFIRGTNEAPCCDFFEYEISAIAVRGRSADFNGDGTVSASDLAVWKNEYGQSAVDSLLELSGDSDLDGNVDGSDFLSWQRQFGQTMPSIAEFEAILESSLALTATASAVPEPTTLLLASMVATGLLIHRRRSA